jgi:hypothetical protein
MLPVHRRATRVTVLAGSADVGCVDTAPASASAPAAASASSPASASTAAPAAASAARFNLPQSLCQPDAHTLLIADRGNGRVRLFDLRTGAVRTMAGGGFSSPDTNTMTTATTAATSADSTDATAAAPASTLPSGCPTTSKAAHALSVALRALSSVCVDPSMPGHVLIGAALSSSAAAAAADSDGDRRGISRLAPDGALPFVREFFLFLFESHHSALWQMRNNCTCFFFFFCTLVSREYVELACSYLFSEFCILCRPVSFFAENQAFCPSSRGAPPPMTERRSRTLTRRRRSHSPASTASCLPNSHRHRHRHRVAQMRSMAARHSSTCPT